MKRLIGLAALVILLYFLTSCEHKRKQREVRAGLDNSVGQLPDSASFETITISYGQSSMKTCHYAEAVVMLGTALAEEEALDTYVDELRSLGWALKRIDYKDVRVLIRDTQERIVIRSYHTTWLDEKDENYIKARDVYPTIIWVRLVFYVPQRDGC